MVCTYYGQELYHHGILGMKWGVRRYQNKDGTLTEAGKKKKAKEKQKSDNYVRFYTQYNNEKESQKRLESNKEWLDKVSDPKTGRTFVSEQYGYDVDEAIYQEELLNAKGEYTHSLAERNVVKEAFDIPVSSIDTASLSFKEVKAAVNDYLNQLNNAVFDEVERLEKS